MARQPEMADGDRGFAGVNSRVDPASLEPGMVSAAENIRFRNGVAESRLGTVKPAWLNNVNPPTTGKEILPFTTLYGATSFQEPNGLEHIVLAADGATYYSRQGTQIRSLSLPTGVVIKNSVQFVQAFNKVIMFRGVGFAPLLMSDIDDGFEDLIPHWDITKTYTAADEVAHGPWIDGGTVLTTTLDGAIEDDDTEINLTSTTDLSTSGVITIESEKIRYTGITDRQLTGCDRGYDSTTEAAHGDDLAVTAAGDAIVRLATYSAAPPEPGAGAGTAGYSTFRMYSNVLHGFSTYSDVTIRGADESDFDGRIQITGVDGTTFTFTITGSSPGDYDAGSIEFSNMSDYWSAKVSPDTPSAADEPSSSSTKWTQLSNVMPNAETGIFIQNRLAVITNYDSTNMEYSGKKEYIFFSDILDIKHTFFSQQLRINQGDDSELLDLVKINENQVLAFKGKNISLLTGIVVGDGNALGQSLALQTLIGNYGLVARGAAVSVGTDCYFYSSRRGVVSITQTEQNKARGRDVPLSEPIQSIIDRVDPRHQDKIRLTYWDNKLYCALPLGDGSGGNNTIAVFDFLTSAWAGIDTGTAIRPKEFFKATYSGAERLFILGEDGFISLYEEASVGDHIADSERANKIGLEGIAFKLTTRGYHNDDLNNRFFRTARLNLATNNPQYSVKLKMDGVGEEQDLVTDRTKNRLTYYRPFDAADWDESNVADDHATPYREDYSVRASDPDGSFVMEDGSTLTTEAGETLAFDIGDADPGWLPGSGVHGWKMQEIMEPYTLSARSGRYGQLEVSNNQGAIAVRGATMTTSGGPKTISAKA